MAIGIGVGVLMLCALALPFVPGATIAYRRKKAIDRAVEAQKRADVLFFPCEEPTRPLSSGRSGTIALPAGPSIVIVEPEPEKPNLAVKPNPGWAGEQTNGYTIVEAYDTEWLPTHAGPVAEAERAFFADPLGSWCPPPESVLVDLDFLPEAAGTFDLLVTQGRLTGEGWDIDTEWEAWNLYETERVTA